MKLTLKEIKKLSPQKKKQLKARINNYLGKLYEKEITEEIEKRLEK